MLVICNGAIKSGSTWLFNILSNLRPFSRPDDQYLTLNNERHPCIRPDMLRRFLSAEDYVANDYLSKNHLSDAKHRDMLALNSHVYVFDIERDPKDVIVSNYYHDCFRNGYSRDFSRYYWEVGRDVAASLACYHDLWRNIGPRAYTTSYENLHSAFAEEVRCIANVLNVDVSDHDIERIKEETSLRQLRSQYQSEPKFEGEKFFRKGEIGDWKNHFDEAMLVDIEKIERGGIGAFDFMRIRNRVRALFNG